MVLSNDGNLEDDHGFYDVGMTIIVKGQTLEFRTIWEDFSAMNLSSKSFYGKLIGDLTSLHHLNFSHNALNGSIPKSFGKLKNLESLDLSVGSIPEELGGLTFLSKLNLSYNKLVGVIPKGRQTQHSRLIHLKEIQGYAVYLST
ncbi:hypothetical protein SASPL_114718 [Salvia splendens]|uniref:Uncharacterized protein n=1 Tax=Salvia splendens TaxID=180675 RepID=A0A8X9A0Z3_SALSN|nr:hypothetical protein SASPL_114718 [Salvia splendens]